MSILLFILFGSITLSSWSVYIASGRANYYPKEPTFGIEGEKDLEKDSELASALATLKVV